MARVMNRINSIDVRVQDTVPKPNITWEDGSYSMEDVLNKFLLPKVIQCQSLNDVTPERSNFDFLQPMLLYSKRRCYKVTANSLNIDSKTGSTTEIGGPLLVPEDYKGWFAVLKKETRNKPVPHYRQVCQLAQSDCDRFLIGGSDCVQAVQKIKKDGPPVPRVLYPGDELRKGNIYVASTKVRSSLFAKSQIKEEKFLLCIDQNDREVLLPIGSSGMFYVVKNKTKPLSVPVRQIKDIIANTKLPCEVKLIFGRLPTTPCSFTGQLVLKSAYYECSAVASSIVNLRNILLEIPSDIPMKFRVAVTDNALLDNKGFQDAVRLCQEKAETYMRNIKVSHGPGANKDDGPDQREQETDASSNTPPRTHRTSVPINNGTALPIKLIPKSTSSPDLVSSPPAGRRELFIPRQFPTQASSNQPLPARVPLKFKSKSTESASTTQSSPRPPPQASKPPLLDRVVTQGAAPPLVRIGQSPDESGSSSVSAKQHQYDEVWLEPNSAQKNPPVPPPKCVPSSLKPKDNVLWRQKSITISVNDGYLTVPVYPTSESDSSPDEVLTLADKINFWKRLDETSHVISNPVSHGTSNNLTRTGSITYSECGVSPVVSRKDRSGSQEQESTRTLYENIENLRQFRMEAKNQTVSDKDDNAIYEPAEEMPVGWSANRSSWADSGIMADGVDEEVDDICPNVSRMTVTEVYEKLKEVGVNKKTREFLKKEKVDGRLLTAFNEETLISSFPSISKIEIKKIGLFVRGWKPK